MLPNTDFSSWWENITVAVHNRSSADLRELLLHTSTMRAEQMAHRDDYLSSFRDKNVDQKLRSLLCYAGRHKYNDIAMILVNNGAQVDYKYEEPFDPDAPTIYGTFLELLIFYDNFALFKEIGFDKFNFSKYLCWDSQRSNNFRFELFWLNLICYLAVINNERNWLKSLLKQDPQKTAANIINKYVAYSELMSQCTINNRLSDLQMQLRLDQYITAPIVCYSWSTGLPFSTPIVHEKEHAFYLTILQREGEGLKELINRFEYLANDGMSIRHTLRIMLSPGLFFGLIISTPKIISDLNSPDPIKVANIKDKAKILLPTALLSLDAVYVTALILIALTIKAIYRDRINILCRAESNILRSYQGYLLSKVLENGAPNSATLSQQLPTDNSNYCGWLFDKMTQKDYTRVASEDGAVIEPSTPAAPCL